MKNLFLFRSILICSIILSIAVRTNYAQISRVSYGNAFNMLNSGNKYGTTSSSMQGGSILSSIISASYTKKVTVSYGIPISIVMEYAVVKANLSSDVASDPDTYNNSSGDVQQAFDNLIYSDFVKISDYKKINVKLNFRFNPPQIIDYGSIESDYLNNTQSSPWDAQIYKMPNTQVCATKIMVIQK